MFNNYSKSYAFVIKNPEENVMYDDLLGPDLVEKFGVFPIEEKMEENYRVLVTQTNNELVTPEMILEVFKNHGVEANLLN